MKSFLLLVCTAVLCSCTLSVAQTYPSNLPDPVAKVSADTALSADNDTVFDTSNNTGSTVNNNGSPDQEDHSRRSGFSFSPFDEKVLISIVAIFFVFGSPAIILFIIFYFRYKNRQARYRLVQQALEKGQPLPMELFRNGNYSPAPNSHQGIRNTFLGIGLFIFLWAVTGDFGIGTIGLLIACIGIGQWVSDTLQQKREAKERQAQLHQEQREQGETEQ